MNVHFRLRSFCFATVIFCATVARVSSANAQEIYTPTPENLKAHARDQAVFVPLATGLAFGGLLPARTNRTSRREAGFRQLGRVSDLHGRAITRVADKLWRNWRHLVRRHVGQAGRRLASLADVRADSSTPAASPGRQQSSQEPLSG